MLSNLLLSTKTMASSSVSSTERDTLRKLRNFGRKLHNHLHSDHKLLQFLDKLELVLSIVEQNPPDSLKEALVPSMKALVSEELLRHSNEDVRISVTACLTEVIRITAPDAPYDDEPMKEILKLIVEALEKLSHVSGRCYEKALTIVRNVSTYRIFLIMLDLYCDDLVVEMFRHFVTIIRSNHPNNVIDSMEDIMTMTLNESEEISPVLLRPLLECVKKENQALSPISWRLGEKVITNCAVKLKPYLMQAVESSDRVLDEYAEIVTSVCQNQSESLERNHSLGSNDRPAVENNLDVNADAVEEPHVDVTGVQIMDDPNIRSASAAAKDSEVTNNSMNSIGSNVKTKLNSESQLDTVPRKRGRKPNSLMNPEEGYEHSWISLRRSAGKSSRSRNAGKPSQSRKARDSSSTCPPSREDNKINGNIAKPDQSGKTSNIASDFPSCEIMMENHEHVSKGDEPKTDENVVVALANRHIPDGSCPGRSLPRKTSSTENKDDHRDSVSMLKKSKVRKDSEVKPDAPIRKITFTLKIGGKAMVNPESEVAKMESGFCEEEGKQKSSMNNEVDDREEGRSSAQTEGKKRRNQNASPKKGLNNSSDMKGTSMESASRTSSNMDENRKIGLKRRRTTVPESQHLGNSLVAKRIKVWWPLDMTYYEGVVYSYDAVRGKHEILYDDGVKEMLNLKRERWELIDANNVSPDKEQGLGLQKLADASDMAEERIKESETESLKGVKINPISRSDLADDSTDDPLSNVDKQDSDGKPKTIRMKSDSDIKRNKAGRD